MNNGTNAMHIRRDISVMKFGGSSFAKPEQVPAVCGWIKQCLEERGPEHRIVCVVSAPSGLTEQYREAVLALNPTPSDRLIDAGLPLADSVGAVMVAAALQAQGVSATVTLGNQIGLRTDRNYTRARLLATDSAPLLHALRQHRVVVVPGGQASAADTGETMWMGKNSSDLSAIALAGMFGCEELEIYSDVPGVYSSDPNIVRDAILLPRLAHRQAIEMSTSGAKVLHHRAVQHALEKGLRIVCRRNAHPFDVGTVLEANGPFAAAVVPDARSQCFAGSDKVVEQAAQLLEAAAVTHCVLPGIDPGTKRLVVTCGFFDARHFLTSEHRLALAAKPLALVTLIRADGKLLRELVPAQRLAARAADLHAHHVAYAAARKREANAIATRRPARELAHV